MSNAAAVTAVSRTASGGDSDNLLEGRMFPYVWTVFPWLFLVLYLLFVYLDV